MHCLFLRMANTCEYRNALKIGKNKYEECIFTNEDWELDKLMTGINVNL